MTTLEKGKIIFIDCVKSVLMASVNFIISILLASVVWYLPVPVINWLEISVGSSLIDGIIIYVLEILVITSLLFVIYVGIYCVKRSVRRKRKKKKSKRKGAKKKIPKKIA